MSAFVTQNQWSPRFAAEYLLTHITTLHAGYARYFKVPPFDQVALETVQSSTIPPTPRRSTAATTKSKRRLTTTSTLASGSASSRAST